MNTSVSTYLNAARFLAAVCVLLDHFAQSEISGGLFWHFHLFAAPAVAVFFVISGYVISYLCTQPNVDGRRFGVDRAARILSVSIPAVVLTFTLDMVGQSVAPDVYVWDDMRAAAPAVQAFLGATFLSESWFGHVRVGSNGPYWSLSYEVWYYVAFGLMVFGRGAWGLGAALVALVIAGPKVGSLFPLWLVGVATHRVCSAWDVKPWASLAALFGVFAGLAWYLGRALLHGWPSALAVAYSRALVDLYPDYIVGALFGLSVAGAYFSNPVLEWWVRPIQGWVAVLANTTFSLYLFHFPVMAFLRAISPWPVKSWQNRSMIMAGIVLVTSGLSYFTERRRHALRRVIWRCLFGETGQSPTRA